MNEGAVAKIVGFYFFWKILPRIIFIKGLKK